MLKIGAPRRCLYSERDLIFFSNICVSLLCVTLFSSSVYVCSLFIENGHKFSTMLYTNWIALALVAFIFTVLSIIGAIGGYKVRLELLLWNFWGTVVFWGPLVIFTISSICSHGLIGVWMWHHWADEGFEKMRYSHCQDGTAMTKCMVPIKGGDANETVASWCQTNYNATDCIDIKTDAYESALGYVVSWSIGTSVLAFLAALGLLVSLVMCVRIVTMPVIMRTLFDLINYLQVLPAGAALYFGVFMYEREDLQLEDIGVGTALLIDGCLLFVMMLFGLLAGRWKNRKMLLVHICLMVMVIGLLIATCAGTFLYIHDIHERYGKKTEEEVWVIACRQDLYGCCCCEEDRCPEWEAADIVKTVQSDLIVAGLVSIISIIFAVSALITSYILHDNLKGYKTDSI
mmetsp:Transcript_22256/g.28889  ORF Transcript_22256/g.28889 Transcript_22256/m.28889 type:complete len:402 (+) Transcript_22256:62-1267(+)